MFLLLVFYKNIKTIKKKKYLKKATQRGSNWGHQLGQTNWMVLLLQMIDGIHAGSNF